MLSLIRCKSCGSYLSGADKPGNDTGTTLSACPACGAPTKVPIHNATPISKPERVARIISLLVASPEAWFVVIVILAAAGLLSF